jgi:hypothetical protein
LSSGIVPTQLKIAKVVPVLKLVTGLLWTTIVLFLSLILFSKVLERVVHNRLSAYLNINNLLSNSQYGFRKEHSTIHPLTKFLNYITRAFNDREHCVAIFCDLRKAFDTVDHSILLTKLHNIGIQGQELKWFKNYLLGRKQFVVVNGKSSTLREILLGVPQGSILGPLFTFRGFIDFYIYTIQSMINQYRALVTYMLIFIHITIVFLSIIINSFKLYCIIAGDRNRVKLC